jgi:2,4-dienoyl-CoA reductase-like NADH-dependent reductase (Old Yellow Enzyme family)
MRLVLEVVDAVRAVWPDARPLLMRVSATDWVEGGWDVESSVELARAAAARGVDLVDVSSGGLDHRQEIAVGPGYQVPFAAAVRAGAAVPTAAVGLITEPAQAEQIVAGGEADAVLLARALLRNPRWALGAAHELGAEARWPDQYVRARL